MFTQSPSSSHPGITSPVPSSPPAANRGSRLRGYLRNYTQNHILSRDSGLGVTAQSTAAPSTSPVIARAITHPHSPPTGRRRSRQSVAVEVLRRDQDTLDLPSLDLAHAGDDPRVRRATSSTQPPRTSAGVVGATSDSEQRREKKHKTGAEGRNSPDDDEPAMSMTRTRSATTGDLSLDVLPSIRFSAHYDPRSTRQSLSFTPLSRTLPTGKEIIKVGRYSEREQQQNVPTNTPSAAPVGFKSKVVSRRHCEFWHENGKWYIRDVKSSSGTFLNHIRLSPPGNESKPYIVNDGDIVQLGIDFRGGEEMIFRCVKMRIELNRGWQTKPNNFNMATHKRLRNMTSATSSTGHAQDCSICLNAIAPCQSLFVAPCSHTWHYKCIRELLTGPSYPIFTCPNCRAAADLDADIEEPDEAWQQLDSGAEDASMEDISAPALPSSHAADSSPTSESGNMRAVQHTPSRSSDAGDVTMMIDHAPVVEEPMRMPIPSSRSASRPPTTSPVAIPQPAATIGEGTQPRSIRTPSPNQTRSVPHEGPLTPRNDAGPWVFDGDAGRSSQDVARPGAMVNLDAATTNAS